MEWPEVIIPLAGMLTTLVGTFVGIFAGIRTERDRWEKEQRTRFHPDRYAKYTEFLEKSYKLSLVAPLDESEEDRLFEDISEAYSHIEMLGGEPVREAAKAYFNRSIDAKFSNLRSSKPGKPGFPPTKKTIQRDLTLLRKAFVEAARKELGITSESLT